MNSRSDRLTARQQEILDFIRHTVEGQGRPPTRAEVCAAFGFRSPNAAETHLRALAAKGAILLEEGRARGIRLAEALGLPLIGRVAAGSPILAAEHIEDVCAIPPDFFRPQAHFLLRVRGDSMINAGILDGDLLAVHKTNEARDGEIVVARIEDEVTVKRLERSRRGQRIRLLAENPDYDPIEVDLTQQAFAIEGLSVGVLRRYD